MDNTVKENIEKKYRCVDQEALMNPMCHVDLKFFMYV